MIFLGWIIGSIIAWWCLLFLIGGVIASFVNEQQVQLPDWVVLFVNYGLCFGGTLLIPAFVAVFALRGKLPGTAPVSGAAT